MGYNLLARAMHLAAGVASLNMRAGDDAERSDEEERRI
jgi:hypothetical protein